MIHTALTVIITAAACYVISRIIIYYQTTQGTAWQRLLASAKWTETILVQYVAIVGGWIVTFLNWLAGITSQPELQSWVQTYLPPFWVGVAFFAFAGLTIFARTFKMGERYPMPGPDA